MYLFDLTETLDKWNFTTVKLLSSLNLKQHVAFPPLYLHFSGNAQRSLVCDAMVYCRASSSLKKVVLIIFSSLSHYVLVLTALFLKKVVPMSTKKVLNGKGVVTCHRTLHGKGRLFLFLLLFFSFSLLYFVLLLLSFFFYSSSLTALFFGPYRTIFLVLTALSFGPYRPIYKKVVLIMRTKKSPWWSPGLTGLVPGAVKTSDCVRSV